MAHAPTDGVMGADYARDRQLRPHLAFRYRARAHAAVAAFRARVSDPGRAVDILDLGCAEGRTLVAIREALGLPGRGVGVDLSQGLLDAAPSRLPPNTTLLYGDVCALPESLEPESFDLVCALAVLEHLPDPRACLEEAHRMLRPGGVIVVTCPNPTWDHIADRVGLGAGDHHAVELNRKALATLARTTGFVDVEDAPFMLAPVGLLAYATHRVPVGWAAHVDTWVRRLPGTGPLFVNQILVAQKER